jgi:DNA-binding response OmpR family regulator
MKVLLVDDEQKFARMLAKRLELRGFNTEVFFSGDKALKEVEAGSRYAVAVLDVKMPGISGIELRRRLSVLDPQMKFVFLTGHGSNADYQVGASEADAYLPKPLKIDDLLEMLNRLAEAT